MFIGLYICLFTARATTKCVGDVMLTQSPHSSQYKKKKLQNMYTNYGGGVKWQQKCIDNSLLVKAFLIYFMVHSKKTSVIGIILCFYYLFKFIFGRLLPTIVRNLYFPYTCSLCISIKIWIYTQRILLFWSFTGYMRAICIVKKFDGIITGITLMVL